MSYPKQKLWSPLDHPMNKCTSMLHAFPRMLGYFPHLGTFILATLTFNQRNTFLSKKYFILVCPEKNWETFCKSVLLTQAARWTNLRGLWNILLLLRVKLVRGGAQTSPGDPRVQPTLRISGLTISSSSLLPDSKTTITRIKTSGSHPKPKARPLNCSETGFSSYVIIFEKSYTDCQSTK